VIDTGARKDKFLLRRIIKVGLFLAVLGILLVSPSRVELTAVQSTTYWSQAQQDPQPAGHPPTGVSLSDSRFWEWNDAPFAGHTQPAENKASADEQSGDLVRRRMTPSTRVSSIYLFLCLGRWPGNGTVLAVMGAIVGQATRSRGGLLRFLQSPTWLPVVVDFIFHLAVMGFGRLINRTVGPPGITTRSTVSAQLPSIPRPMPSLSPGATASFTS
jgi:hypothetical protein